jgi:flagellar biosynthesis protein FlhB
MTLRSPILDFLLLAHVVVGLLGYGSLALTGSYAHHARRLGPTEGVRRYFDGTNNLAQFMVYLVPVFGVIVAIAMKSKSELHDAWFYEAVVLWVISAAVVGMVISPMTKLLGTIVSSDISQIAKVARKLERGVGVCVVLYVAAFYCMLFKP